MIRFINILVAFLIRIVSFILFYIFTSLRKKNILVESKVKNIIVIKEEVNSLLTNAILSIEDKRYYNHKGIDVFSIIRATIKNLITNKFEGASTITQQLVRNLTNERDLTIKRKLFEIILAVQVERVFSKSDILSAYFASYGFNNCIGVFSFCESENYNIHRLSIIQAAEIAARFKYPNINRMNYVRYLKRVRIIEKELYVLQGK